MPIDNTAIATIGSDFCNRRSSSDPQSDGYLKAPTKSANYTEPKPQRVNYRQLILRIASILAILLLPFWIVVEKNGANLNSNTERNLTPNSSTQIRKTLPPYLYIVEPYLALRRLNDNPELMNIILDNMHRYRVRYIANLNSVHNLRISRYIKNIILNESDIIVIEFWSEFYNVFVPAITRKDQIATKLSMRRFENIFYRHKLVIGRIIDKINR